MDKSNIYIGCSGWSYPHWKGIFYPEGLPTSKWLEYYAEHFNTVELNASFYRLPNEKTVENWRNRVPKDFIFAVKASRYITHIKRLKDCKEPLKLFINTMKKLGPHLGPLLYQLPPNFKRNDQVLKQFLKLLPKQLTHVFEFRHESWWDEEVFEILKQHNATFCIYNMESITTPIITTAPDAYIRLHGAAEKYDGNYSTQALKKWSQQIKDLKKIKKTWVYFNNDLQGYAIKNATKLNQII